MIRRIIVFGREPIPGRVKTRLAHDIGEVKAAEIYQTLLERTLGEAIATGVPVVLSLAEALSGHWDPPQGLRYEVQTPGNLGRRMHNAFLRQFAEGADLVLLIGSDCPTVTRIHLLRALELLVRTPVVLGPAEDGGYWGVGQEAPGVDCFSGVPWSSSDTLQVTREQLRLQDVRWAEMETLSDVDTVEDLVDIEVVALSANPL